jgi:hypothetical protein
MTHLAVVTAGDERVEFVKEDDARRRRSGPRKDLPDRTLTLSDVL